MADQLLSIAKHDTLPESYIRPESERPGLAHVITDADVPVVDLGSPDKPQMISQIANACQSHGFFQVVNHGVCLKLMRLVMDVGRDFFHLPPEEKAKLYSDDPAKKMRLSTSFNVRKETIHNWRDYLRLHCYPLDEYVLDWPSCIGRPGDCTCPRPSAPKHVHAGRRKHPTPPPGSPGVGIRPAEPRTDGAAFFVASKTIKKSDLDPQQNRFFLPLDSVDTNLVPMLSEAERAAANLVDCGSGKRKRPGQLAAAPTDAPEERIKRPRASKEVGRAHGGLEVTVFMQCGFQCYLKMTRWDGSRGTVIKGNEMKVFRAWSCLKPGDEVEVWAFRMHRGGGLCFAIGRPTSS